MNGSWTCALVVAVCVAPLLAQGEGPLDPAALRRAIWLDDREAAATCAMRLQQGQVDRKEAARVVELLMSRVSDPAAAAWYREFLAMIGRDELGALLAAWPRRAPARWSWELMRLLVRSIRAEHVPALCALARDEDPRLGEDALRILGTSVIAETDRHRELIGSAYLSRVGGEVGELHGDGGFPPVLAACLEHCLVRGVEREGEWRSWLCRWVRDARPGPADLPLLRRLASRDEWYADRAALFGLGALHCDESLAALRVLAARLEDQDDARSWFALAMLARRGDGDALEELTAKAREEGFALAFLIEVDEARGRALLYELLCSGDDDLLDVALGALTRADLASYGAIVEDHQLVGVRHIVATEVRNGFALARIVAAIPACRDAELARRAAMHSALQSPPYFEDHGYPGGGIPGFLAFLEVADVEALANLLRAWAASEDEDLRDHGHRLLLTLGRPADAERLVSWIASGGGDPEDAHRLGEVRAAPVEEFLREQTARDQDDEPWERELLAGLAVCYGMPPELEWVGRAIERFGRDEVREQIRARRPVEVIARLLEATLTDPSAGRELDGIGLVRDRRVRAYLRELQRRRELGHYAWATGQLALMGERDAESELRLALGEGRWCLTEPASPRVRTLDRDLDLLQHWTDELESNSLHVLWVDEAWDELFGFGLVNGSEPPVIRARRWRERWDGPFRWSRLAGAYVPGPR